MIRLPTKSTLTNTLFPYTTLFRSGRIHAVVVQHGLLGDDLNDAGRAVLAEQRALRAFQNFDPLYVVERLVAGAGEGRFDDSLHNVVDDDADRLFGRHQQRRGADAADQEAGRSEEHTSALQSLMRISYAVFCLKTRQ